MISQTQRYLTACFVALLLFATTPTMAQPLSEPKIKACKQIGYTIDYMDAIKNILLLFSQKKFDGTRTASELQSNWNKVTSTVVEAFDEATRENSTQDDRNFVRRLADDLKQKISVCQSNLNLFIGGLDPSSEQINLYVNNCIKRFNLLKKDMCLKEKQASSYFLQITPDPSDFSVKRKICVVAGNKRWFNYYLPDLVKTGGPKSSDPEYNQWVNTVKRYKKLTALDACVVAKDEEHDEMLAEAGKASCGHGVLPLWSVQKMVEQVELLAGNFISDGRVKKVSEVASPGCFNFLLDDLGFQCEPRCRLDGDFNLGGPYCDVNRNNKRDCRIRKPTVLSQYVLMSRMLNRFGLRDGVDFRFVVSGVNISVTD